MCGSLTLGVHLREGVEQSRRVYEGVVRYRAEHPHIKLRDFNFFSDDLDTSGKPPWSGIADGMVIGAGRIPGIAAWLKRGGVPVVNTAGDLRHERGVISVFCETRSLVRLAADHFLKIGRRNIGFVGHRHTDSSQERIQAFASHLANHDVSLVAYETNYVLTGTFQDYKLLDDVEPRLVNLVKRLSKPCGIFCLSDRFAITVCRIAHDLGFAVPDDVALIGVGDFDVARQAPTPISSIRPDNERSGYEAARLAHLLVEGRPIRKRIMQVPALELVARESTLGRQRAAETDIERALDFIQQRVCEGIRVADVAKQAHMPLRTFELEFAKAVGHSAGEAIRRARLARVKELLKTTDLPLSRIAKLSGLANAANLNRFFRQREAMTATDFRHPRGGRHPDSPRRQG